jgi:hypothetical protein
VRIVRGRHSLRLLALLAAGGLSLPAWSAPAQKQPLTSEAKQVFDWVARSRDNEGLPFIIIDKRRAHVWVFDRAAQPRGDAPVLLGSARGDHSVPGIGELPLSQIRPQDRTTPAGRFRAEVGRNLRGEAVVWVDYDGGVSMHPVLTTNRAEKREQRLATPTPADNRVSFGCINVPTRFHETVVLGTVRDGPSIVYVLPETRPLPSVFTQLAASPASAAGKSSTRR